MTRTTAGLVLFLVASLALSQLLAAALEDCTDCLSETSPGDCLASCPLCSCGGPSRSEPALDQGSPSPLAVAGQLELPHRLFALHPPVNDVFHVPRASAA